MPEKVTKDEKIAELLKKATEKAVELIGNKDDFNEDDLTGETVKLSRPKAQKVPDAKGSDEEKTKIRDEVIAKEYIKNRKNASALDTLFDFLIQDNRVHKATVFFEENKADIPKEIIKDVEKFLNEYETFENTVQSFLDKYDESYGGDSSSLTFD